MGCSWFTHLAYCQRSSRIYKKSDLRVGFFALALVHNFLAHGSKCGYGFIAPPQRTLERYAFVVVLCLADISSHSILIVITPCFVCVFNRSATLGIFPCLTRVLCHGHTYQIAYRLVYFYLTSPSIFAAKIKSFSDNPWTACVESSIRTRL